MKEKRSFPWAPILILAVLLLIVAGLALPAMQRAKHGVGLISTRPPVTGLYIAAQNAALDAAQNGSKTLGWPADAQAPTWRDYLSGLITNGYLRATDAVSWKADQFVIGNVSDADPADTIFLVSRNWYDAVVLKKGKLNGPFVVIYKGGDGQTFKSSAAADSSGILGKIPPRDPPFLAP